MPASKAEEPPFSMDENLLHISYEGGVLEDLSSPPPEDMWLNTKSLEEACDEPEEIEIEFYRGDPISVNGENLSSAKEFFYHEEEEALQNKAILVIEWPELIEPLIKNFWKVEISYAKQYGRYYEIRDPKNLLAFS